MSKSSKYSESLNDPRWQRKRLEIMRRDDFKCVACGDDKSELHVHHATYDGMPWETADENLQTLCRKCHDALPKHPHAGVCYSRIGCDIDNVIVEVSHCPMCGCHAMRDKGSYVKCAACSEPISIPSNATGVAFSKSVRVIQ